MFIKTKIAVAAALILGAASAALAKEDDGAEGSYSIGPTGQCFSPTGCGQNAASAAHYRNGGNAYGFVPPAKH